ncbi:hypothetical protein [Cohnella massiliensis]|uniref:hypothetical protein n=1 Tax=Cohnella massiliensis TaxID=1816691 RepID=UPI0009BB492E|nr:hypothetical protein [Cohnella massiliensis]
MNERPNEKTAFIRWTSRIERGLLRTAAALAAALLVAQLLLQIPSVRHFLSGAESHEGIVYHTR